MKLNFLLIIQTLVFHLYIKEIHGFYLKSFKNGREFIEKPHEIGLGEDQKTKGQSKIIFTQDPASYFYVLQTPPLKLDSKEDFDYEITNKSFLVTTKVN